MTKRRKVITGLYGLLVVLLLLINSHNGRPVFAGDDYPNLGVVTPINVPACNPNSTTVVVSNNVQLQPALDNPAIKVICLNPGNYTEIKLEVSGTAQSPRYLVPNHAGQTLPKPWNLPQNQRVIVDNILFKAAYWYVVGLNVVGDDGLIVEFRTVAAYGNAVDSMLVEGESERMPVGTSSTSMVRFHLESFYNTVQNSVIRNPPRIPYEDSHCLVIRDSSHNTVINNQIYDCPGDSIQFSEFQPGGRDNRGNKIFNNEIYLTNRLYADCSDPSIDANLNGPGECACAENGVDIKYNVDSPVSTNEDKLEIRGNVVYGFRETHQACGGTGDGTAPGMFLHQGVMDILIEQNVIANSDTGVLLKDTGNGGPYDIDFFNNLLYNINKKRAIHISGGENNQISHNTVVLTTNDGNVTGRHSIAVVGNAVSGIISNNLVLSTNDPYRGYTDVANTGPFTVINNVWVRLATPITGLGTNDKVFPNDSPNNYAQYCFDSQKHTAGIEICFPYLIPGPNAASVDTINTTNFGLPYDFFFRPRSLPYDAGASEVPIFDQFFMLPAVLGN